MKYITSLFFAILLLSSKITEAVEFIMPDGKTEKSVSVAIPKDAGATNQGLMQPIIWRIRKGENLTRISERYNLTPEVILQKNAGGLCIKSRDLILANCAISVPVIRETEALVIQKMAQKALEATTAKVSKAKKEVKTANVRVRNFMTISGSIGLILVLLLWFAIKEYQDVRAKYKFLQESSKNLASKHLGTGFKITQLEEIIKNLEQKHANAINELGLSNAALHSAEAELMVQRTQRSICDKRIGSLDEKIRDLTLELEEHKKVLPGSTCELSSKENGKIMLKILRVDLTKNGELEVFVGCPVEGCDLHSKPELKKTNALSHIFRNHGTTEHEWAGNGGTNA